MQQAMHGIQDLQDRNNAHITNIQSVARYLERKPPDVQQERVRLLVSSVNMLKAGIADFHTKLLPSTTFALMETAIYTAMKGCNEEREMIPACKIAGSVLARLIDGPASAQEALGWGGSSFTDQQTRLEIGLKSLSGLNMYIEYSTVDELLCWTTEPVDVETTPADGDEEPLINGDRTQELMTVYRSSQPPVEKTLDDAMDLVVGTLQRKIGESHWNTEEAKANIRAIYLN